MRRPVLTDEEVEALCYAVDVVITMITGADGTVSDALHSVDKKLQRLMDKIDKEDNNNE